VLDWSQLEGCCNDQGESSLKKLEALSIAESSIVSALPTILDLSCSFNLFYTATSIAGGLIVPLALWSLVDTFRQPKQSRDLSQNWFPLRTISLFSSLLIGHSELLPYPRASTPLAFPHLPGSRPDLAHSGKHCQPQILSEERAERRDAHESLTTHTVQMLCVSSFVVTPMMG
jgi:hypothetical protein